MLPLETAERPEKLRRIAIDPITRVEGHGKITILLDEQNIVQQVRLHVVEFRGFEVFIKGRPYWEVPVIVQRLCGICPVSHHLAAAKAMDQIAGYPHLTPTAEKLRRLMHYGQILQSHALHFFHLASPDLLLGFDSEVSRRNIMGIAAQYPELAMQGILLRKFGQEIIRVTCGKRIHGTGAIPGGMNKAVTETERLALLADAGKVVQWSRGAVELIKRLYEEQPDFFNDFGNVPTHKLAMVNAEGALDFYHGTLTAIDANGAPVFKGVDYSDYRHYLGETVKPWSYMKFSYIADLGEDQGWYQVGPLARLQVSSALTTPLAEAERQQMLAIGGGKQLHGTLLIHWARVVELLHAAELIQQLLEDKSLTNTDLMAEQGTRQYEAVGVIEAPRGTLVHHYRVDEESLVSFCNLIVSTTHNNQAMNQSIRSVAKQYVCGHEVSEALLNHVEVAIRAYDPCLSCATHALGKMPLTVELYDHHHQLLDSRSRGMADC